MNRERLEELAKWLEAGAPHEHLNFDMAHSVQYVTNPEYAPGCKTACCIAGAAVQFYDPGFVEIAANSRNGQYVRRVGDDSYVMELTWRRVKNRATELLGLEDRHDAARDLFTPWHTLGGPMERYNDPATAARAVRSLLDTGEVRWDK